MAKRATRASRAAKRSSAWRLGALMAFGLCVIMGVIFFGRGDVKSLFETEDQRFWRRYAELEAANPSPVPPAAVTKKKEESKVAQQPAAQPPVQAPAPAPVKTEPPKTKPAPKQVKVATPAKVVQPPAQLVQHKPALQSSTITEPTSGSMVEVGWIAACETFDLNARLANVEPKDYIVWLWRNRDSVPLCNGVPISLVIYDKNRGKEIWRTTASTAIHRVKIPEELALKAEVICAEVQGHMITHAAQVEVKGGGVFASCSFRLPDSVRSGRAHGGFGIPLILQRKEGA